MPLVSLPSTNPRGYAHSPMLTELVSKLEAASPMPQRSLSWPLISPSGAEETTNPVGSVHRFAEQIYDMAFAPSLSVSTGGSTSPPSIYCCSRGRHPFFFMDGGGVPNLESAGYVAAYPRQNMGTPAHLTAVALNHVARPRTTAAVCIASTLYLPSGSAVGTAIAGTGALSPGGALPFPNHQEK